MTYIQSYPNQTYLIPPKITDLFSKDHICYLIEQIVGEMDFSEFDIKYSGAGHPAYHPRINLKLLTLAYLDGIRSSRKIAKNAQENVVYIYLAEKVKPNFRTISDFRKDNPGIIRSLFRQITKFAQQQGLIDLSHLIIDGTKIKANAYDDRILDKRTLTILDNYIDKVIEEGIKTDEEEDKFYGDRSVYQLPEDLNDSEKRRPSVKKIVKEINKSIREGNTKRVQKIKSKLQKIDKIMDKKDLKKYSLTDSESRFMRNKKETLALSYNAQLVVDKNGLALYGDVVQSSIDKNELLPAINGLEQDFGQLPKGTKVLADAGYENSDAVEELDKRGYDLFVPGKYGSKSKFYKSNFDYDEEKDIFICPENKQLIRQNWKYFHKRLNKKMLIYKCSDCTTCPHQKACCKTAKHRVIHAYPQEKLLQRIKKKLKTTEGKEIYRLRKETVEISFGDIKHNKNFRMFLLRGLEKVKIEFNLVCIARNLVKINNLLKGRSIFSY